MDVTILAFGPKGALPIHDGHFEDVDWGGDTDLLVHFETKETGIGCGDIKATLTGETIDGVPFTASHSIRPVPHCN